MGHARHQRLLVLERLRAAADLDAPGRPRIHPDEIVDATQSVLIPTQLTRRDRGLERGPSSMVHRHMAAMKWWGWGEEGEEFTHEDKPDLAPFIAEVLGVQVGPPTDAPVRFESLQIADPMLPDDLRAALEQAVADEFVSVEPLDRVVHARGKSLRDLIRQRRGDMPRVSDVVVRPDSEDEVTAVVQAALRADAVVIPFGGGSSISGSLEAPADEPRPVISVDLSRMDKVLAIDEQFASRARAGRRLRSAPGGAAARARVHVRSLPRLVHALDARRLDRHTLLGHAVRPLRRHR